MFPATGAYLLRLGYCAQASPSGLTLLGWLQQVPSALWRTAGSLWCSDNVPSRFLSKALVCSLPKSLAGGQVMAGEAKRVCSMLMMERTAHQHSRSSVLHMNCSTILSLLGHLVAEMHDGSSWRTGGEWGFYWNTILNKLIQSTFFNLEAPPTPTPFSPIDFLFMWLVFVMISNWFRFPPMEFYAIRRWSVFLQCLKMLSEWCKQNDQLRALSSFKKQTLFRGLKRTYLTGK